MNWDTLHPPNVNHCLIHLLGINFRGVFGKKFWCFLHSWLWPCTSHAIYLTEQNAKIELNNWKGKTEIFWTPYNKVDDQFFKTSKLHWRKKNWPLGCTCCIIWSFKLVGHHFWPSLIPLHKGRALGVRLTSTPGPNRDWLVNMTRLMISIEY